MQLQVFTKKIFFLIRVGEMIFFDMAKKYTIFVEKLITQILFKIQKIFCIMKKFRMLAFQQYKIFLSKTKEWQRYAEMKKKSLWVPTFFLGGCI